MESSSFGKNLLFKKIEQLLEVKREPQVKEHSFGLTQPLSEEKPQRRSYSKQDTAKPKGASGKMMTQDGQA